MEWAANMPFSKNDFWINTKNYMNMKNMKVEATLAIAFAIAEDDYKTAEDIALTWIDTDHIQNKLGKAYMVKDFLADYLKFAAQAIDRMLQKEGINIGDKQ